MVDNAVRMVGEQMSAEKSLTAGEEAVMKQTFKATMLRAASIIERISADDVLSAQARMLAEGMKLEQAAKIDRAMLGAQYLRACASGEAKAIALKGKL